MSTSPRSTADQSPLPGTNEEETAPAFDNTDEAAMVGEHAAVKSAVAAPSVPARPRSLHPTCRRWLAPRSESSHDGAQRELRPLGMTAASRSNLPRGADAAMPGAADDGAADDGAAHGAVMEAAVTDGGLL